MKCVYFLNLESVTQFFTTFFMVKAETVFDKISFFSRISKLRVTDAMTASNKVTICRKRGIKLAHVSKITIHI